MFNQIGYSERQDNTTFLSIIGGLVGYGKGLFNCEGAQGVQIMSKKCGNICIS